MLGFAQQFHCLDMCRRSISSRFSLSVTRLFRSSKEEARSAHCKSSFLVEPGKVVCFEILTVWMNFRNRRIRLTVSWPSDTSYFRSLRKCAAHVHPTTYLLLVREHFQGYNRDRIEESHYCMVVGRTAML